MRKAQNPIAQATKRIKELEKTTSCKHLSKKVHICISTQKKDSCFLLKNRKIAIVKEKRANNTYLCDVINRSYMDNFYDSPCESKWMNVVVVKRNHRHYNRMLLDHTDFDKKLICLPYEGGNLFLPMLHCMERW